MEKSKLHIDIFCHK